MQFVTDIYKVSADFPKGELYGLTAQIRRSAISIPSNIAEGYGRNAPNDLIRFLQIAMGSLCELQTQLEISKNLDYLQSDVYESYYESTREIERMLRGFIQSKKQNK